MFRCIISVAALCSPTLAAKFLRSAADTTSALDAANVLWYGQSETAIFAAPLDFSNAYLSHSNLGGQGPDSGSPTLIFANVSRGIGSQIDMVVSVAAGSIYDGDVSKNKIISGGMGQINIYAGVDAEFDVKLVESGSMTLASLPRFFFSIFDIDAGNVTINLGVETNTIGPVDEIYMYPDADLAVGPVAGKGAGFVSFTATSSGRAADNPTTPFQLTHTQSRRAVMVEFRNKSRFTMSMKATPGNAKRNMLFAGPSDMAEVPIKRCNISSSIHLASSVIQMNTLGEPTGPKKVVFRNASTINGTSIDLTVTATGNYNPWNPTRSKLRGDIFQVNMGPTDSATFTFSFSSPMVAFFMTFYDIDQEDQSWSYEKLTLLSGSGLYFRDDNTTVKAKPGAGNITFMSTDYGNYSDNPYSTMGIDHLAKAVTLSFDKPVSDFTIKYETSASAGRNFAFGGYSGLACR